MIWVLLLCMGVVGALGLAVLWYGGGGEDDE